MPGAGAAMRTARSDTDGFNAKNRGFAIAGRSSNLAEQQMGLHPDFPVSPYAPLIPEQRWFPADETMRATAYEKLLPPLVSKVRKEVFAWRNKGYAGASATSAALLKWWFETEHLTEEADGSLKTFNYYFA